MKLKFYSDLERGFPAIAFIISYCVGPIRFLENFTRMPGDLGDARFNNYILENIYLYSTGKVDSLVNQHFYAPFPLVGAFSDNLIGAFPFYFLPRIIGFEPDTSYQLWFIASYLVNYIACYYVNRKFGLDVYGSSLGALTFTFALPVSSQIGHAQLLYRFGVPLCIYYLIKFYEYPDLKKVLLINTFLLWQFYCSIYIGFFSLLFIILISIVFVIKKYMFKIFPFLNSEASNETLIAINKGDIQNNWLYYLCVLICLSTQIWLFYILFKPYIDVVNFYKFKREWVEISFLLPRLKSYMLSDISWIWHDTSASLQDIPLRHEHQLFIGLFPILCMLFIVFSPNSIVKKTQKTYADLLIWPTIILFVFSLFRDGDSLWHYLIWLPLFSSIRAVTRIILVLLLPVSILVATSISNFRENILRANLFVYLFTFGLIAEFSAVGPTISGNSEGFTTYKKEWRERIERLEKRLAFLEPSKPLLFVAQTNDEEYWKHELDVMIYAQRKLIFTMNGYSGNHPPYTNIEYGNDCREIYRRITSYLILVGQADNDMLYKAIARSIQPIDFVGCDNDWQNIRFSSVTSKVYSADSFRNLSIIDAHLVMRNESYYVDMKIKNNSNEDFAAISIADAQIRIGWRYVYPRASVPDFDLRMDIPENIKSHEIINVTLKVDRKDMNKNAYMEIAMVQENAFWSYNLGIPTTTVNLQTIK